MYISQATVVAVNISRVSFFLHVFPSFFLLSPSNRPQRGACERELAQK